MWKLLKQKLAKKLFEISETERKIILTRIDIIRINLQKGKYTAVEMNLNNLKQLINKNSMKGN